MLTSRTLTLPLLLLLLLLLSPCMPLAVVETSMSLHSDSRTHAGTQTQAGEQSNDDASAPLFKLASNLDGWMDGWIDR